MILTAQAGYARADYLDGVSIAEVSSEDLVYGRQASHVLDGSGLAGLGHTSSPDGSMWDILASDAAPRIGFDLGAVYSLGLMGVWNYNAADFGGFTYRERGVKDVRISTSLDGVAYDSLGLFTLAIAPGADGYLGEAVELGGATARFVRLDIVSNYSADGFRFGAGLSEVRFAAAAAATPEPAGLALLGVGAGAAGIVSRRRRPRRS